MRSEPPAGANAVKQFHLLFASFQIPSQTPFLIGFSLRNKRVNISEALHSIYFNLLTTNTLERKHPDFKAKNTQPRKILIKFVKNKAKRR